MIRGRCTYRPRPLGVTLRLNPYSSSALFILMTPYGPQDIAGCGESALKSGFQIRLQTHPSTIKCFIGVHRSVITQLLHGNNDLGRALVCVPI